MKFFVAFLALVAVAHAYVPRLDGTIGGGQDADIRDFQYQVSVRIYDKHICGGTILDGYTIITAAHCVYGMDHSQYSVRVGNNRHAFGTSHLVNKVIQNEEYNPNTIDHDIAILKLASSISFGSTAQVIPLQSWEMEEGTTARVTGWGVTSEGNQDILDSLRVFDLSIITNAQCIQAYGTGQISSHMMCAQTLGHDSCQGESGGPLVAKGRLTGVVSWGYGCARPEYPVVYAKVSAMYNWIMSNRY